MSKKTYYQLLKDPRWQKKRLEIFERDEFQCQHCGDRDETLNVHHIAYNNGDPWDIDSNLLITLCEVCHGEETEAVKETISTLVSTVKECGMMSQQINNLAYAIHSSKINWLFPPNSYILVRLLNNKKCWEIAKKEYYKDLKKFI